MILTIDPATVGFEVPLRDYVEAVAAAQFQAVEFSIERAKHEDPDQLIAFCHQRCIALAQFTCGLGIPSNLCVSQRTFEEGLVSWHASCEFARRLGCSHASMLVNSVKGNANEPVGTRLQIGDLQQRLYQVCSIAQIYGIEIAVELADADLLSRAKEIIQGVWEIGGGNLGLLLDTYGLSSLSYQLSYIAELLQVGLISWVHLADAHWDQSLETSGNTPPIEDHWFPSHVARKPRRVLPAQGYLPLVAELCLLQQYGYTGHVSIEVYGEQLLPTIAPAERARVAAEAILANKALQPFFSSSKESDDGTV